MNQSTGSDYVLAKGANSFGAVSDLVHKSSIKDHSNVEIELSVNGETRQHGNTSQLIFDIPTLVSDISKYQELKEGDLIMTGTPEGVGSVFAGDKLSCVMRNGGEKDELIRFEMDIV